MNKVELRKIKTFNTLERGQLSALEELDFPFPVKRIFWITGVEALAERGKHGHKYGQQFIVPMNGMAMIHSFGPGLESKHHRLSDPSEGLYVPAMHWLNIRFVMNKSALLVLASNPYSEDDYIRNWDDYVKLACSI